MARAVHKELQFGKLAPLFDVDKGPEKVPTEHDAMERCKNATEGGVPLPCEIVAELGDGDGGMTRLVTSQ